MPDILLIRHGAYQGHRPGHHAHPLAPLSDLGHHQAHQAANRLPDRLVGIVTSPVLRARQTARAIATVSRLPLLRESELLAEWRAPSAAIGRGPDTYPTAYARWKQRRAHDPDSRFEDGESLTELYTRAHAAADWLHEMADSQGPILAVSHMLLLGVLTRLPAGPAGFEGAVGGWDFCHARPLALS